MKTRSLLALSALALAACSDPITRPGADPLDAPTAAAETASRLPDLIPLPDGFQPEGITSGRAGSFYVGSLADGRIYKGSYLTGAGSILVEGASGVRAVGMDFDERSNLLWVATQSGGSVYDGDTGIEVARLDFPAGFANDVVVTRDGAYFTDSFAPTLFRVALESDGMPRLDFTAVGLGGDFRFVPGAFNANGIAAVPGGGPLLVVNSATGRLYAVDPGTGTATHIAGVDAPAGDGLHLDGRQTLYVVQSQFNQIAEVRLSADFSSGEVVDVLTNEAFDVPTTLAAFGPALYAVNARFTTPPTPATTYEIVRVEK